MLPIIFQRHTSFLLGKGQFRSESTLIAICAERAHLATPGTLQTSSGAQRPSIDGSALFVEEMQRRIRDPARLAWSSRSVFVFEPSLFGQLERLFVMLPGIAG